MIEALTGLPDGVLGFEASGKVTGDDYENVLVPAIEAAVGGEKLHMVYVLGEGFEGYSAEAMWDDAKIGMRHPFSFEKVAVVTDDETYSRMIRTFGFMMPAEVRVFALAERDEAIGWAAS